MIRGSSRRSRGFTLIELMITLVVGSILTAMAIPQVKSTINSYRLHGAVASATWAIHSTRYEALKDGCPYQVVITQSTNSYRLQSAFDSSGACTTTTFTNVSGSNPVPLSGASTLINQNTTLRFKPNGVVSAPVGALTFAISYQGKTGTVTVSNYGNVSIAYN